MDFYVNAARECGGPVLEAACGTGRVLIPTAQAGIEITGIDSSDAMLAICRNKLARESIETQSRTHILHADIRNFNLGEKYNLITIPYRPFQHLIGTEDQMECLATIHRHLSNRGKLIFDTFNPCLHILVDEKRFQEIEDVPNTPLPDGRSIRRCGRVSACDYPRQVQQIELIYYITHPDGRQERQVHNFAMRYFFRYELEHLLARCGFHVETVYSGFDIAPFGTKYPGEIIMVASKT